MPVVSIIIPVYNAECYLHECIDSVLVQTYRDLQILLVDDGSVDNSGKICDKYATIDCRIQVIHKDNGGLSSARNTGISHSSGEYIFFVDADDAIHPDTILYLLNISINNDVKISTCRYVNSDIKNYGKKTDGKVNIYKADKLIKKVLYQDKNFDNCAWGKLYHKSIFTDIRFRDTWFEDLDVFYRLYEIADKIAVSERVLYFYRKHNQSFINKWSDGRCDIVPVVDRIVKYIEETRPSLLKAGRHRQFSAYYNVFLSIAKNNADCNDISEYCYDGIKRLRINVLFNPKSRLKNRIGAIASLLGHKFILYLAKWTSR